LDFLTNEPSMIVAYMVFALFIRKFRSAVAYHRVPEYLNRRDEGRSSY